jgi:tellurite methyltransferase
VESFQSTQGWDLLWAGLDTEYWRTPEPSVLDWAERLWEAGGRRALDLGCGIGRHAVGLARRGFAIVATDAASSGLATCADWLAREGLSATLACHNMEMIPFPNNLFDGLVSYNVIYHTTVAGMRRALTEIHRVLNPGGWLYVTITARDDSKIAGYRANIKTGKCVEIEPFTFVYPRDAPDDKYLPHHYCDEAELQSLLMGFSVDDLHLVRKEYADGDGVIRFSIHYHVQARRNVLPYANIFYKE